MLRAILKHVPSWNMSQIGIVCRSEKCAVLKHASDWHCANFVILKSHVKCKVLKHKNLCKETKSKAKLLHFVSLFLQERMLSYFKFSELKTHHCCLPLIWQSLYSANLKHVSKWHIFQNGTQCQSETCFRTAHVLEQHVTHACPIYVMYTINIY